MEFPPEAKVYRVRIDVEVVGIDRQDAVDGAIKAWRNGGDVGERVAEVAHGAPKPWMAYGDGVRSLTSSDSATFYARCPMAELNVLPDWTLPPAPEGFVPVADLEPWSVRLSAWHRRRHLRLLAGQAEETSVPKPRAERINQPVERRPGPGRARGES